MEDGVLILKGHIRNAPLHVESLMHVVNIGTLRIRKVERCSDGKVWLNKQDHADATDDDVLFANPDALEGEQNLIGFGDDNTIIEEDEMSQCAPERPMDHQSAWMSELDPDGKSLADSRALSDAFNIKKSDTDTQNDIDQEEDADDDLEEEKREKALRVDEQFPDEVELSREVNGQDRYARYRSLKNFRKSYWDPMENLPDDYGRLFQFANFKGTRRDVIRDTKEAIRQFETPDENEDENKEVADVVVVEVEEVVEEEKDRYKKEEYYIKSKSTAGKEAFGNAVGQTAPLGYWDPIGFTQDGDQDKFDTYQLFEITHGRVSMLAVTGYLITGPLGVRFPGAENVPAGFSKPIATLLETKSGQNILLQMLAFFTVASIINRDAEWLDNKAEHVGDFRNGSLDVGWNSFSDEEKIEQRNKEINNGRAAMMGILGLYVHEMMGVSILPGGWLP